MLYSRPSTLLRLLAAGMVLLASGLAAPRSDAASAARSHRVVRGWQVFLPHAVVQRPSGIAIDLRGARHAAQWGYVADAGTGRIVKFGTGGRVLRSWRYAAAGDPAVLAVGGAGNLFVANQVNGDISKFSAGGKRLALWTPAYFAPPFSPAYSDPRAIALDPAGKIYLAEYSAHRIIQLSPGGTPLQTWDTAGGFPTQYSVPHLNTGPLGDPTGVVYDPDGHLFISTVCVPSPACLTAHFTSAPGDGHDVLSVLALGGPFAGYVGNFWFGLGYTAAGAASEPPGKESEVFVHIAAMAGDGRGHTFLAGTMWPRGGEPSLAVLSYTDLGYHTAPWSLPSRQPVAAVAVDGSGAVYVSQGAVLLKRSP